MAIPVSEHRLREALLGGRPGAQGLAFPAFPALSTAPHASHRTALQVAGLPGHENTLLGQGEEAVPYTR